MLFVINNMYNNSNNNYNEKYISTTIIYFKSFTEGKIFQSRRQKIVFWWRRDHLRFLKKVSAEQSNKQNKKRFFEV